MCDLLNERCIEAWLDDNTDFVQDYFSRKATSAMVDQWLTSHALRMAKLEDTLPTIDKADTPVRRISSQEFEMTTGSLQPMVSTIGGAPCFLSPEAPVSASSGRRKPVVELSKIDERDLMWELVKDICNELDFDGLCHKILCNVSVLVAADRCSLFLVHGSEALGTRCLVSHLFDVHSNSRVQECLIDKANGKKIFIPWGAGIAGFVAENGKPMVVPDAYQENRFNTAVDEQTGYRTRSLMCFPIKDTDGEILGVAQAINKQCENDASFSLEDQRIFSSYLAFCGIVLKNAQLYERSQVENRRCQVLLDLARMVCEEQCRLANLTHKIMKHAQSLLQCQLCQILLLSENTKSVFSQVFQYEPDSAQTCPTECEILNTEVTGYVATTGQIVNIPNLSIDDRFSCSGKEDKVRTQSVLCVPIRSADHQRIIGVFQLINKMDGSHFTKNDEQIFEAFAIFCGIGIENTVMHDKVVEAQARQSVALEVLAYHAVADVRDVDALLKRNIRSSLYFNLNEFTFSDFSLDDSQTIEAGIRMFMDLDLIERFHINYEVLCRWILSVKKNYRDVSYHNWRHALNVTQFMFAMLKTGRMSEIVSELESMCLLVACLCHDLDHRGTNNQFQLKTASPLSRLYSTSVLEHHHFDHCIMLLNTPGNQIFSNLDQENYERAIEILENAILATDLALYFKNRESFFKLVDSDCAESYMGSHRQLLFGMMMTACDISSITKPWEVQQRVAIQVANEFFAQGDLERTQLNEKPGPMMDRSRADEIPSLQVAFIDSICLPLYQHFTAMSPHLHPMLVGCLSNRNKWSEMADKCKKQKAEVPSTAKK